MTYEKLLKELEGLKDSVTSALEGIDEGLSKTSTVSEHVHYLVQQAIHKGALLGIDFLIDHVHTKRGDMDQEVTQETKDTYEYIRKLLSQGATSASSGVARNQGEG